LCVRRRSMSAKHDGEEEPGYWRTHVASCRKIFAKIHRRTFVVKRHFVGRYAMTETDCHFVTNYPMACPW
jgi:hypothetical protein